MPLYRWRAIDLAGIVHYGNAYASSHKELDAKLLSQEMGLLSHKEVNLTYFRRVSSFEIMHFFKELALLLHSGVFLDHALGVLAQQSSNRYFATMLNDMKYMIGSGRYLNQAMSEYSAVFSPLMIHMIQAGQESGSFVAALEHCYTYQETMDQFYKRLRSALLLPMITLLFFLFVALIIFIVIIPRFARIFSSMQQEVPALTQRMIAISDFLQNPFALMMFVILLFVPYIAYQVLKKTHYKKIMDQCFMYIPLIRNATMSLNQWYYLQALALLLRERIHIIHALALARSTMTNHYLQERMMMVEQEVSHGLSLSQALQNTGLWSASIIGLIQVGHESGCLPFVIQRAADRKYEMITRLLGYATTLVYPLIMIFLGLLITFLIVAVYIPVFNMSHIIQ